MIVEETAHELVARFKEHGFECRVQPANPKGHSMAQRRVEAFAPDGDSFAFNCMTKASAFLDGVEWGRNYEADEQELYR